MKRGLVVAIFVFLLIFAITAVAIVVFLAGEVGGGGSGVRVSSSTLLEIDFEKPILEYAPPDPFGELLNQETPKVRQIVEALEAGATDDRVVGLVARMGNGSGLGFAQIQEVRRAILAFRESGKPAVAYAETFGEGLAANGAYYLATAFDQIYLQPSGDVNLTGLYLVSEFYAGTFEKLDVQTRMDHRHEYKNAMNSYTQTEFTEPHEEAMKTLMDSLFRQMVREMAIGRGMDEAELKQQISAGPFLGQEALETGLVDELLYRDQVISRLREQVGDGADLLYAHKYYEKSGGPNDKGTGVALIYGVGGIARGPSQYSPLTGGMTMGSDTVAAALRAAIEDDDVEAILFRIDCNGGSYVASDTVWREVKRAREMGKPVIASFGNVAASGGYFVALEADKIVAQPATITGSIGVFGGKVVARGLFEKLGLSWDSVQSSDNAHFYSTIEDYSDEGWDRMQKWLDRIYEDFTNKVASGRDLPIEDVLDIAKGRVWTGEDALERGLVDALGGYDVALDLVRESLELEADAPLHLQDFPRPRTPWEEIFSQGPDSSGQASLRALMSVFEELRPMARLAHRMGLLGQPETGVVYPEEWIPQP